jgi:predicted nucleic acid-binding Zn ribbon protein
LPPQNRSVLRHSNDQSLGSVIKEFLHSYHLEGKFSETRLLHSWEKVVGKMVAVHTKELRIHNKILFVRCDSAALRNELSYERERIMKLLNQEAGSEVIDDIVFS